MLSPLIVVVVRDLPDDIADVRGTAEQNADQGGATAGRTMVPILSDRWGRPRRDNSSPVKRCAWGFWASTALPGTRQRLNELRSSGFLRYYVWDSDGSAPESVEGETFQQFNTRWKAAVNWTEPQPVR